VWSNWWKVLVVAAGVLVVSWGVLLVLARRLPSGSAKELAGFLPNCVRLAARLRRHPSVPRRAKVAVGLAGLWVLSPIDLIPEFLPVIGPLDDVIVVALALRYAARRIPRDTLLAAWDGDPRTIDRLLGTPRPPLEQATPPTDDEASPRRPAGPAEAPPAPDRRSRFSSRLG
jgi:uncharacterized membrane protein YkvA (DUF1232 family)